MTNGWICVKTGTAACRKIVHVAPWMIAAYMAVHPLPTDCPRHTCHFVIPKAEFRPGGMFAPGHPPGPPSEWHVPPTAFGLAWTVPLPHGIVVPPGPHTPPVVTTPPTPGGPTPRQPVPEPSSLVLLGAGLLALGALRRVRPARRRRARVRDRAAAPAQ